MNKKILAIGSIIACVIILLASLSPVVGYNSARSSVKDSPLFSVRSKRAIDQESDGLTCEYVGKGDIWSFPTRDADIELVDKIINIIKGMDDKSFDKFVERIISYIHQNNKINNIVINDKEIKDMLNQLRDNSELIKNNIMLIENKEPLGPTIDITGWECILVFLMLLFALPFVIIITIIRSIFDIIRFILEIIRETNPSLPTFN